MSLYDSSLINQFMKANNGPLNSSTSKQLYSFPKAQRFRNKVYNYCSKSFYDQKSTLDQRSTTIGYGNKTDFTKLSTPTPAPGSYQISTSLLKDTFSKSQNSFGTGRVAGKIDKYPGPQKYNMNSTLSRIGYSMRSKNEPRIATVSPGPGAYLTPGTLSPNRSQIGKFMFQNQFYQISNSPVPFLDTRVERSNKLKEDFPGPQKYSIPSQFSPESKHPSQRCATAVSFGKEEKLPYPRVSAPGPGKYSIPGEFGFY